MTCEEFSNEFDTLLNSYNKIIKFGDKQTVNSIELDEYEKSSLLTQAQEELITEYYTGKNPFRESFENTEEIRRVLSELVKSFSTETKAEIADKIDSRSVFFTLPQDIWYIVYEQVVLSDESLGCKDGTVARVKPVTHDNYFITNRNPFKRPNSEKVFRLDIKDSVVEIISAYNIQSYFMRYVSKPQPIILVDLDDLTINGVSTKTECELNPVLHRSILQRAVQIALQRFNVSGN